MIAMPPAAEAAAAAPPAAAEHFEYVNEMMGTFEELRPGEEKLWTEGSAMYVIYIYIYIYI